MKAGFTGRPGPLPLALVLGLLCLLGACGEGGEGGRVQQPPVAFRADDECHVCGMLIARFAGPKGEAYVSRRETPLKFCSTRDLFAWLLQPETAAVVGAIYVHDMAQTDWRHPDDTRLIDARSAWYVVGSRRRGAMGPTLASFARRDAAQAFADRYGGRLLRFDEITLSVFESLLRSDKAPGAGDAGQADAPQTAKIR